MQIAEELLLPCQPRVFALLMRELLSDMPNLRRVSQLFSADPVLAGLLLECANAPAQQMVGQVRGIPQAVTLLGVRQLRSILKKAQSGLAVRPSAGFDLAQFAQVSVASAKLARSLAAMARLDASMAYMAGLVHGLGQLVWCLQKTEQMQALQAEVALWDPRRPKAEQRHMGYSANHTSALLLRHWSCPADMVAAVQGLENPMEQKQFDPVSGVVHLAVWCQRAKHGGWSERQIADAFPVDVAIALGLDVDVVLQQESPDWSKSIY